MLHRVQGACKKMRLRSSLFAAVFVCVCHTASADLISPAVQSARDRLSANPNTYDRVDNFCTGKKPGGACLIAGSTFAGGGEGTCRNNINTETSTIDLTCVRNDEVLIDRKLPAGGFVYDPELCRLGEDKESGQKWDCKPMVPTPADQFCKGKGLGSRCMVELTYRGRTEQHSGTCKQVTETEKFYFWGYRTATRQVIRCEPPPVPPRTYTPASWRQKLLQ